MCIDCATLQCMAQGSLVTAALSAIGTMLDKGRVMVRLCVGVDNGMDQVEFIRAGIYICTQLSTIVELKVQ